MGTLGDLKRKVMVESASTVGRFTVPYYQRFGSPILRSPRRFKATDLPTLRRRG